MKAIYQQIVNLFSYKFIGLFTTIVLLATVSNAQINNSDFAVKLEPQANLEAEEGESEEIIFVKAKDANENLHGFNITFTLPQGIEYVVGSMQIEVNPNDNYQVTYVTSSSVTQPEFQIRNISGGGADNNWGFLDELKLSFKRKATCDAVTFKEGGGIFKDKHKIDYFKGGTVKSAQDFDDTVSSYGLLSASLSVTDIAPITGEISNITTPIYYTRDIQDVQGGNGDIQAFHHEILVGLDIHNYEFKFNGAVISPSSTATDAVTGETKLIFDIDLNQAPYNVATAGEDGNGQYENGESFTFQEKFAVLGCAKADIIHTSYWNCQKSGPKSASIILGNQVPGLKLTQLEGSNEICETNHFRVKIENTTTIAGGGANDVYINIGLGHNDSDLTTYDVNPFWAYDFQDTRRLSNVRFTGGPAALTTFDNPSTLYATRGSGNSVAIPPNFFTTDPDGPGGLEDLDNDGFYDDMAPGASTIIELDIDYNPKKDNCGVNRFDYVKWEHLYFDVNIKDQCYLPRDAKRLDFGYKNLIRDYLHATELGGDKDASGGQAFEFTLKPAMYSSMSLNGHNAISADADSEFSVTINVPVGVAIDAAHANAGLFTQVGNTITYKTTNLNAYPYILRNIFSEGILKFPLKLDCATYTAANASTAFTVDYTTHLTLKDATGTACFNEDIHCGTSEPIQTHGCAASCNGPAITKFETSRTTAGFTDNTMTTQVDLSQAGFKLDNYLVGDIMKVVTEAKIQNTTTDKMFIDINYTTDGTTLGADDIQFVDGTIHIFDSSSNTTTADVALTGTPTITSSGNNHTATFNISTFKSLFDNNMFDSDDNIFVTFNYKFNTNISGGSNLHKLTNFKGEYHSVDGANNRVSCDTYGSTASYLKVRHSIGKYEEEFANCEEGLIRAWATEAANVSDMFPNEYRPPFGFNKMTITLPDGYKFTGKAQMINQQGTFSVANNGITASQTGNIVTMTPTANFRNGDQRATYYPSIRIWVKGTCGAVVDGDVTFKGEYNEFHYGASTPETPMTTTKELHYTKPTFALQSASSSIVNGDASEATFDINVASTTPGNGSIDFNWIKVGSNVTVTTAFDMTTGTPVALNLVQSGGITWVELGALTNGTSKTIQIKATYNSCTEQVVNFAHGWDCDAYPTTQEYVSQSNICYENNVDMTLLPRDSEIQLEITEQPDTRITMCDPFHIKLRVNSAQFAGVINPRVEFSIPGLSLSALDINSIKVRYPYDAATAEDAVTTINGEVLSINIFEHNAIKTLGELPGTNIAVTDNDRTVEIDLALTTTCDFISSTPLQFKVFGDKPCGDPAEGSGSLLYSEKIRIDGAEQPYDAFSTITLPNNTDTDGAHLDYCGTTESVTISTIFSDIIGQATTKTEDSDFGSVAIPAGVSYVDGSFSSTDNITLVSSTSSELVIQYPQGLLNLDRVNFTFDIRSDDNGGCATDADFSMTSYVIAANVLCNGVACTQTKIITGESTEPLDLLKPSLTDAGTTTATVVVDGGVYAYRVNLSLINTGLDATAGYTYDIFCADATGNPDGTAINSGTIDQTMPSGATVTQTISFDESSLCGNNKIVFVVNSNANCLCDTFLLPIELNANSTLEATINALDSTFECDGTATGSFEVMASQGSPEYQYSIDGGVTYQSDNTFVVSSSGDYTATVRDSEGFTVDVTVSIIVEANYQPMTFVYESTGSNEYEIFPAGGKPPYEYAIDDQDDFSSSNVFEIDHTGTYTIYVKDDKGCIVELQADLIYSVMQIPNFFTPDGDSTNDTWYPKYIDLYPNITVDVFDRYQRLVASYKGIHASWDGYYKNKMLPSGDYWYHIKLNDAIDKREFKGNVTLYRSK